MTDFLRGVSPLNAELISTSAPAGVETISSRPGAGGSAGAAGAAYGLLFGYVGASLASTQYSILPLLWVLLGGAGTVLGPLVGALSMFYLIDYSSAFTTASLLVVGVALVLLVLFAPRGILGTIRERWLKWLP